jgi:hypothetical protein
MHAVKERKTLTVKAMQDLREAAKSIQEWDFQPLLDALEDEVKER